MITKNITNIWSEITDKLGSGLLLQNRSYNQVFLFIGATSPDAESDDGIEIKSLGSGDSSFTFITQDYIDSNGGKMFVRSTDTSRITY